VLHGDTIALEYKKICKQGSSSSVQTHGSSHTTEPRLDTKRFLTFRSRSSSSRDRLSWAQADFERWEPVLGFQFRDTNETTSISWVRRPHRSATV